MNFMNRLPILLLGLLASVLTVGAQQLDQPAVLYSAATNYLPAGNNQHGINYLSQRGSPISSNVVPALATSAYDGRSTNKPFVPTPYQFQSVLGFGGGVVPASPAGPNVALNAKYEANYLLLSLPRDSSGPVTTVLRTAQLGASTFSQQATLNFGSVVPVPTTDENGQPLPASSVGKYWNAQPFINATYTTRGYYYSANASQVFALDPGTFKVCWQKSNPVYTQPPGTNGVNYNFVNGAYYLLYPQSYTTAAGTAKPSRLLYWTENSFQALTYIVSVPAGSVGQFNFIYTDAFPQTVPSSSVYNDGSIPAPTETRTVWYDSGGRSIHAYNLQGRVFLEVLGDPTSSGNRAFLGYEIVDVRQQPGVAVLSVNIGDRIAGYADGTSDAALVPQPLASSSQQTYLYADSSKQPAARTEYYAVRVNPNPSDVQVYWTETGVAGLQWPRLFTRYNQTWPADPSLYTQYLRPPMSSISDGTNSAVLLPSQNSPSIQYEEELDYQRSFLDTSTYLFYTYVDNGQPQTRTLLLYRSGNDIAFERVFSTLSSTVYRPPSSTASGAFSDTSGLLALPGRSSALKLDGTGNGQLPPGNYFGSGSFTIESWVNARSYANWSRLMDFGNGPGTNSVVVALTAGTTGNPNFTIYTPTSPFVGAISSSQLLPLNQWAHLAAIYDDTGHTMTLYLNGINVGSVPFTNPAGNRVSTTYNYIGKSEWNSDALAQASLDSFRIWTSALTTNQLATAMATSAYPAGTPGLVVQYAFDESGNYAYDSSGHGYHMQLLGGAASTYGATNATLRQITQSVPVGARINAPAGELGSGSTPYLSGWIRAASGTSYSITAYIDPAVSGFAAANDGAIIPINAIPGANQLEVWWYRTGPTNATRNPANGFAASYWPEVIGIYTLVWPNDPASQIVMANNAGTGPLSSLQAKGTVYIQNDPTQPGYNPNEEHCLMIGGQGYALRDDLNVITSGSSFTSQPYLLLSYTESDGRPAMRPFHIQRENPAAGMVFDYVTPAGQLIQAPMPLPVLAQPLASVSTTSNGVVTFSTINYNHEVIPATSGDWPVNWTGTGPDTNYLSYKNFTYRDRKNGFWMMRGVNAGLPALQAGTFTVTNQTLVTESFTPNAVYAVSGTFTNVVGGGGTLGVATTNYIHTSRPFNSFTLSSTLPAGGAVQFGALPDGLAVYGTWRQTSAGPYTLTIADGDGAVATVQFSFSSTKNPQAALNLNNLTGRPPALSTAPTASNSFTMVYYYPNQTGSDNFSGFAWPGYSPVPTNGQIVPYLRPLSNSGGYSGTGSTATSDAQQIVYRPYWPANAPTIAYGETLTVASAGRPAIRGQSSANVLYQQSIALATNSDRSTQPAVTLNDPTRQKTYSLTPQTLDRLPDGVYGTLDGTFTYFPNLPPHLADRLYFDPNASTYGSLIFRGEFVSDISTPYLQLNLLAGADLQTVKDLCPSQDLRKSQWDAAVQGLAVSVETYYENPQVPGQYIVNPALTVSVGVGNLVAISDNNTPVDSYALSAAGPGKGFVTLIMNNGTAFTPPSDPVSMYVMRVTGQLFPGVIKVVPDANPLSEQVTFEHSADLAGRTGDYQYEWKMAPPVDGFPPQVDASMSRYQPLISGSDYRSYNITASGVASLSDNWLVLRYKAMNPSHPLYNQWSAWTAPALSEGYVKRAMNGVSPFNQRVSDLSQNTVSTNSSILSQAGKRYEGDIALNADQLNNYGLIEIYETILNRARNLSINAGINYGPANDSLLLAAGNISDLYTLVGDEAFADADNPTIGISTSDPTYGSIATALFSFQGVASSLLEEELALLQGRDDVSLPGVTSTPVYNRLVWNYTGGINSGQPIYALNYNIQDKNADGRVDATDADLMFPQGHGDAYGHYLTAHMGYISLLMNPSFDWVPVSEAVDVLGLPVSVNYMHERKFAGTAASVARTGRQIFDLAWRKYYVTDPADGWEPFANTRVSSRTALDGSNSVPIIRNWGPDQWASRTGQGALLNWVVGNAILPAVDPDPSHEGIQKVDRTTVPELNQLVATLRDQQAAMDNMEGHMTPVGVPPGGLAFDLNPAQVTGPNPQTHFEQIYGRAVGALNNAVVSFNDAKNVTVEMRSADDSVQNLNLQLQQQELTFNNKLIDLYGSPYPEDTGPGGTYVQGYTGPDLYHWMYSETPQLAFGHILDPYTPITFNLDIQEFPPDYLLGINSLPVTFSFYQPNDPEGLRSSSHYVSYTLPALGYGKPSGWTSTRVSPGQLQQATSEVMGAKNSLRAAIDSHINKKEVADQLIRSFYEWFSARVTIDGLESIIQYKELLDRNAESYSAEWATITPIGLAHGYAEYLLVTATSFLNPPIIGTADSPGTELFAPVIDVALQKYNAILDTGYAHQVSHIESQLVFLNSLRTDILGIRTAGVMPLELSQEGLDKSDEIERAILEVHESLTGINGALQKLDAAQRHVATLAAQGQRIMSERTLARQQTSAILSSATTREVALRMFRNEKLERYKTLFDLAAQYAYLAAQAYDYETGQLGTPAGQSYLATILNSRALGVVQNGEPQYAGSSTGDPGISSALAQMKADFDVQKSRLGFNNPYALATDASLRMGNLRILPNTNGTAAWQDYLNRNRMDNILEDPDVKRYCLQVDTGNHQPVPGLVLTFGTTITAGQNVFGQPLGAGDPAFSPSYFATKLFGAGVVFEGYRGMSLPGSTGSSDPNLAYLDPQALAATPYVYLIPVGQDIMRSPPLGDTSTQRQWSVEDVAIPLPFNLGNSQSSGLNFWQAANSLTEPLFTERKHPAFRPVDSVSVFPANVWSAGTGLQFSQYSSTRLIGRSVWNTQWKLVIPGNTLLTDGNE
ncbi:MAG: hypothetical protein RIS76_1599, partial [Verrucomicrobiota bacterium]